MQYVCNHACVFYSVFRMHWFARFNFIFGCRFLCMHAFCCVLSVLAPQSGFFTSASLCHCQLHYCVVRGITQYPYQHMVGNDVFNTCMLLILLVRRAFVPSSLVSYISVPCVPISPTGGCLLIVPTPARCSHGLLVHHVNACMPPPSHIFYLSW